MKSSLLLFLFLLLGAASASAQSIGNAGTLTGTITDPAGAVVANATVTLQNATTGYKRTVKSDENGAFRFGDIPPHSYQLSINAEGFTAASQSVTVRSSVPQALSIVLQLGTISNTVEVTSGENIIENVPTSHTDIDKSLIARLPVKSPGAGLSDVVTYASPGVVADSNGFFHALGDHAQSQISLDNQPISDQTSKAFSTQPPVNAIQSLEVITGATPAEYGDKTSMVITAITHSGVGQKQPTGSLSTRYSSFGTTSNEGSIGFGSDRVGNFLAVNFERSGRFLDTPEFAVFHDRGKAASIFDRFDFNPNSKDSFHLNLLLARNNFEIPNTYEQQALGQDQRQLVRSMNIAPGYVHIFSASTVLTINPYFRMDQIWYSPSANPFADKTTTLSQQRRLINAGIKADIAYTKGRHSAKAGVQFSHTFLRESFNFGITDPDFNDPASPDFVPGLLPYDLTRGGGYFRFRGRTNIKQEAAYVQDSIAFKTLTLSLGLRFDNYNGITQANLWQPRLGLSYNLKKTNTVLRASYTRSMETPYNENLVLSSSTGSGGLASGVFGSATAQPLRAGQRHQFNVGFQQGIGRYVVVDADYFWKRTHGAYDFSVLFDTPITFPIAWRLSKIDGFSARFSLNEVKGFTAYTVVGHTRARYFPGETGGLFFNSDLPEGVFRIDHDQAFQQSTQFQYTYRKLKKIEPFIAFSWRYDSGLVAGSVPDYASALELTPDQQAQIGLFCGGVYATPTQGISSCNSANRGALRVVIPPDGQANDDRNPPRIAPRNLFDLSLGSDNVFKGEKRKISLKMTATNLLNKVALYNFLSTFSGTHFVSPRTLSVQMGYTF